MVILTPRLRNASSRRRCERISKLKSVVSKIWPSGLNVTRVPRSLDLPTSFSGLAGRHACNFADTPAVALDFHFQSLRQRVDHRNADAVQTAGNFVGSVVELTASMQFGQHDFGGRNFFRGMNIDGYTAAVIDHSDAVVDMNGDFDAVAMTGQRFIDGIVDNFVNQMVQTPFAGVPDVHARSFSDRFQAF
jgi:hypothetical protein